MRQVLAIPLVYVLFLLQAALTPFGPNLVLLAVLAFSIREDRLPATTLGLFGGLCLDLSSPTTFGAGAFVYALLAYLVASLRTVVYRGRWYLVFIAVVGLLLHHTAQYVTAGVLPRAMSLLISSGLTLLLAVPVEILVLRLYYRR